ncbi:MAG TPA: NADP-dependent oxidoreductase [Acidobacteriota bacterium]|nr:NADP-dependent oxidoreductase [Acidobacteriota bacterium]
MATNRQWRLVSRPEGRLQKSDFKWQETALDPLQEGQVRVRTIYLSMDPANRGWTNEGPSYRKPVDLNQVMDGIALGQVEVSRHPDFEEGDHVQGMLGWQDYATLPADQLTKLPVLPVPLTAYLGVLGHIGLTAYFGLLDVAEPQEGETVVVSAAAGAVGSLVGQIAKIKGCRAVGIAGSDEKCRWITEELGFDAAINYKTQDVADRLKETCPDGIDIYFENVGGEILDAVLARMNRYGRIPVCGLISQYNATEPVPGPYNFVRILTQRLKVQGFIVMDYLDRSDQAFQDLASWLTAGRLKYRLDVRQGLEKAPQVLNDLFEGANQGKLILQVNPESSSGSG